MTTNFKLTGLSKPQSFTCETNQGHIFNAKNGLGIEKFNALFAYCNGNWADKKMAQVRHNGFSEGEPINPIVIGISEL